MKYYQKVNNILNKLDFYHNNYYRTNTFFGPSLYFHKKALEKTVNQYEYIYAALTSWGMHRMGKGCPKMIDFEIFKKSLKNIEAEIKKLRNKRLENLKE